MSISTKNVKQDTRIINHRLTVYIKLFMGFMPKFFIHIIHRKFSPEDIRTSSDDHVITPRKLGLDSLRHIHQRPHEGHVLYERGASRITRTLDQLLDMRSTLQCY